MFNCKPMKSIRILKGLRTIVLTVIVTLSPLFLQAQDVNGLGDDVDVTQPLYKGQLFQYTVKQYIEKSIRSMTSSTETTFYEAEVKITIKENGGLKKVEILYSTGSDFLDRQIRIKCRDFVRKKDMTPAYADGKPIEYSVIVPLMIEFRVLNDNQNTPRYYNWGNSYRGMTPSSATNPRNSR